MKFGESVGEKRDVMHQIFKQETEDIAQVLLVFVEVFSSLNSSIKVTKNFGSIRVVHFIVSFKYFLQFFWFVSIHSFLSFHFCCIIIQLMDREWGSR